MTELLIAFTALITAAGFGYSAWTLYQTRKEVEKQQSRKDEEQG